MLTYKTKHCLLSADVDLFYLRSLNYMSTKSEMNKTVCLHYRTTIVTNVNHMLGTTFGKHRNIGFIDIKRELSLMTVFEYNIKHSLQMRGCQYEKGM